MFKNENGFSLVELAIAAGLAVALAATAVTILSGTTATLSSNANGAAGTSTTYNSDVLANASGAAGSGSQAPVDNGALGQNWTTLTSGMNLTPWAVDYGQDVQSSVLELAGNNSYQFTTSINGASSVGNITSQPNWQDTYDISQASKGLIIYIPQNTSFYNLDPNGNVIAW